MVRFRARCTYTGCTCTFALLVALATSAACQGGAAMTSASGSDGDSDASASLGPTSASDSDAGPGTTSGSSASGPGTTSQAGTTDDASTQPTTAPGSTGVEPSSSGATGDATSASTADATGDASSSGDASSGTTGALDYEILLDVPGDFFTASPQEPVMKFGDIGAPGVAYRRLELELDVAVAQFRDDLPPNNEERWDHVIHGLYRQNQPQSYMRYLLGASARVETQAADRLFNYGRVDISMGAQSYISWKKNYGWTEETAYHLVQWIDADAGEQTLELYKDDALERTITGPVDYFTPALTADQLELEIGTEDADWGLHVSPHGWTFSKLLIRGWVE